MQCNNMIQNDYIESNATHMIKQIIKKYDAVFQVFVNGKIYIERKHYNAVKKKSLSYLDHDYILRYTTPVYGVIQILDVFERRIEKVRVDSWRKTDLVKMQKELQGLSQIKVKAFDNFIEIHSANA